MNKKWKSLLLIVGLLAIAGVLYTSGAFNTISDYASFRKLIESTGVLGYAIYIGVYIIAAVFSVPASIITISAGLIFGPVLGAFLSLTGATVGGTCAFLIARYIARDAIIKRFGHLAIVKKIEDGVKKNGKDFLIFTRLVPFFPYTIQNYAYGLTSMSLLTFFVVSYITMAPGSFIYAYMAGDIAENGVRPSLFIKLAVAGIVLFLLSQLPKIFAKRKHIDMSDFE